MKKFILLFVGLLVIIAVIFFLRFSKSDNFYQPLFSDVLMIEGVVTAISDDNITIRFDKKNIDPSTQTEKTEEEFFIFDYIDNIKIEEVLAIIKTEEEFRLDESSYSSWKGIPDSEKNITNFKFTPSWNKSEEITMEKLTINDLVQVLYYKDGNSLKAARIVKKIKDNIYVSDLTERVNRINLSVEVLEVVNKTLNVLVLEGGNSSIKRDEKMIIDVSNETLIKKKSIKNEQDFRAEEAAYQIERKEIKDSGGDIRSIQTPSWFLEKEITLNDLNVGEIVNVVVLVNGDNFLAEKIELIEK